MVAATKTSLQRHGAHARIARQRSSRTRTPCEDRNERLPRSRRPSNITDARLWPTQLDAGHVEGRATEGEMLQLQLICRIAPCLLTGGEGGSAGDAVAAPPCRRRVDETSKWEARRTLGATSRIQRQRHPTPERCCAHRHPRLPARQTNTPKTVVGCKRSLRAKISTSTLQASHESEPAAWT